MKHLANAGISFEYKLPGSIININHFISDNNVNENVYDYINNEIKNKLKPISLIQ